MVEHGDDKRVEAPATVIKTKYLSMINTKKGEHIRTYGTAHVKLDYRTVSLGNTRKFSKTTRKFSKTTRKLDATTQTCLKELTHKSLHYMSNCSSRVLEQVISCDNHDTIDHTRIWYASLLNP